MDLTQLPWAALLTLVGGGLGGAIFNALYTSRQAAETGKRIKRALAC